MEIFGEFCTTRISSQTKEATYPWLWLTGVSLLAVCPLCPCLQSQDKQTQLWLMVFRNLLKEDVAFMD